MTCSLPLPKLRHGLKYRIFNAPQKDSSSGSPGRTYCGLRADLTSLQIFLSVPIHTSTCVCCICQASWQICLQAAGGLQHHHCTLHSQELVDIAISHVPEKQSLMSLVGYTSDFQDMTADIKPSLSGAM